MSTSNNLSVWLCWATSPVDPLDHDCHSVMQGELSATDFILCFERYNIERKITFSLRTFVAVIN